MVSRVPDNPKQTSPCNGATVGVVIVHGIGVQKPGETLDAYGGALARVWSEFGAAGGRTTRLCDKGHLHLMDPSGFNAALISEAYWADVITKTPTTPRVLWWVIASAPWLLLYTLARIPRPGHRLIRLASWPMWLLRVLFAPFLVVAFQVLLAVVLLLRVPLRALGLGFLDAPIEMVLGDSYLFVMNETVRAASAERVAREAASIAPIVNRMIVIAHSQGAAVTKEAVRHEEWPADEPVHLVSVGSGFMRLRTLRKIGLGRAGMAAGAIVTITGAMVSYLSMLPDFDPIRFWFFGSLAIFWLVVIALLAWARDAAASEADEDVISHIITTWTDMWSTHDLVPDGPMKAMSAKAHRVENARSLIRDHVTYHRNPLEVVVPILSLIDARRFAEDAKRLKHLGRRRNLRLWFKRGLDVVIVTAFFYVLFNDSSGGRLYSLAFMAAALALGWLWSLWHNRRIEFEFLGDSRWFAFTPRRPDTAT